MSDPIKNVLIVGGGTSGWITAAYLARFLSPERCRITLIESATTGTIGVGEASVPPLAALMRLLGINEDDLLRACHATYKLGIQFINWTGTDSAAWHPFGPVGAPLVADLPSFHHWLRAHRGGDPSRYTDYSLTALLGERNRAPRTLHDPSVVMRQGAYAYHLDAREFAAFLARTAMSRGVRRLIDDVDQVALDERGAIAGVDTRDNGRLGADLYIDCSGFAALLIGKALGEQHLDWSSLLLCDRAVTLPRPLPDGPMPPYTRATALEAGWSWSIPLSHRTGCGYVYSSRHSSADRAAETLARHAGLDPERVSPAHLAMPIGRRASLWSRNCVAIGLSAGFLEPLESTGLYLIQKGAELLLDLFPDADMEPALARRYNLRMGQEFEQVRDFILLHYLLNRREEPFWRDSRAFDLPDSLAATLDLYDHTGIVDWREHSLFREESFYAIAAGFGRLPRRHHAMTDQGDAEAAHALMERIRAQNQALADTLPDHRRLIEAVNGAVRKPAAPARAR